MADPNYTVSYTGSARRELRRLSREMQRRVQGAVEALGREPRPQGCVKLTGSPYWRIRVGQYRVIYEIEDDRLVVVIIRVRHRREAYR